MTLPKTMRAIEIAAPGGPEVLRPTERPVPQPAKGEVLIKVAAAGVNGPDIMQRKGLYPAPAGASDLPGLEVAGEVVAAGEGARDWPLGAQVCALTNGGGYAEYCVADEAQCLPIPKGVPLRDAVVRSAATRAQPILLTGLAAMLGAFFILDDPIFNGLAISLIFGIFVSTLLTLVVIPLLYFVAYRRRPVNAAAPAPDSHPEGAQA